jgi:hypothetical protein
VSQQADIMGNPNRRADIPVFRKKAEREQPKEDEARQLQSQAVKPSVEVVKKLAPHDPNPARTADALRKILETTHSAGLPLPRQDNLRGDIVFDAKSQSYSCNHPTLSVPMSKTKDENPERFNHVVTPADITLLQSGNLIAQEAYNKFWASSVLTIEVALPSRAEPHWLKVQATQKYLERLQDETGRLAQKLVKRVDVIISFPPFSGGDAKPAREHNHSTAVDYFHSEVLLKGVSDFVDGFAHSGKAAQELIAAEAKLASEESKSSKDKEAETLATLREQLTHSEQSFEESRLRILVKFGGKSINFRLLCLALFQFYPMNNTRWQAFEETQKHSPEENKPHKLTARLVQAVDGAYVARNAARASGRRPPAISAPRETMAGCDRSRRGTRGPRRSHGAKSSNAGHADDPLVPQAIAPKHNAQKPPGGGQAENS